MPPTSRATALVPDRPKRHALGPVTTTKAKSEAAAVPLRKADGEPIVSPRLVHGLRIVAEAVFSTPSGPPPEERLDWLEIELEDFLARSGGQTKLVLGLALMALGVLAPLAVLRFRRLGSLPVKERVRALERLEMSSLGSPVLALKALLCVLYYEHPDAAREIGFDARWMESVR